MFDKKKETSLLQGLWLFFWASLSISCDNTLNNFEINTVAKPLIVLNARLVARQTPRVYVGKIWGATAQFPVETFYRNADVELFADEKSVGKLFLKDTLYINPNYTIKSSVKYSIKVTVPNIGFVESEPVLIPPDGLLISATYDTKITVESTGNTVRNPCLVTAVFKKLSDVAAYSVDLIGYNDEGQLICGYNNLEIGGRTIVKSPCFFETETPYIDLLGNIGSFKFGKQAFVSKCIDTPEKEVKLMADLNSYGFTVPSLDPIKRFEIPNPINKIIVSVVTISKEELELAKSIQLVEGFTSALSEPYPTYSNIKGGLGIVTGYNVSYKILYIK
jgi:hypothetical protein